MTISKEVQNLIDAIEILKKEIRAVILDGLKFLSENKLSIISNKGRCDDTES